MKKTTTRQSSLSRIFSAKFNWGSLIAVLALIIFSELYSYFFQQPAVYQVKNETTRTKSLNEIARQTNFEDGPNVHVQQIKPAFEKPTKNDDNAFAGVGASGGTGANPTVVQKAVKIIEEKTGIDLFGDSPSNSTDVADAPKPQPKTAGRCLDDECVKKSTEEILRGMTSVAAIKGTDEEGNDYKKEIITEKNNSLGGETVTTVTTRSNTDTGYIKQTKEILVKTESGKIAENAETTFTREKQADGTFENETTITRNGQQVFTTDSDTSASETKLKDITGGKGPNSESDSNSGSKLSNQTWGRGPNSSSTAPDNIDPNKKCKAGNVTVAAGTWVATGFNMGGDGNQRQCVQIASDCTHVGSRACHEVYNENPAQIVLPSSAGTEYTVGLAEKDVSSREMPRLYANCITNGETVPSGNEREDVGVCDNGRWVPKAEFDREQLDLLERNQGILKPTTFETSGIQTVTGLNGVNTPTSTGTSISQKPGQDPIYTGFSISLAGGEIVWGTDGNNKWAPKTNIDIISFNPDKVGEDGMRTGVSLHLLGSGFKIEKKPGAFFPKTELDLTADPPSTIGQGIISGATSCIATFIGIVVSPACAVIGGVWGGINDFITDEEGQSSGTSVGSPAEQINDTGPSQINIVTTPKTAGNTGGFNLSADINNNSDFEDNRKTAKMSYFNQKQYSTVANADGSTWDESGCGIMSGAMVMSMIDPSAKPEDYNALLEKRGGASSGGTGWFDQHKPILEEQGFNIVPVAGSTNHIANQINEYSKYGIPVWINSNIDKPDGSKGFGHQTLAVGTCPDGSCIILNDPYYGENYEMPIERFDVDCSNTCDGGRTTWVVNAIIPPTEAK